MLMTVASVAVGAGDVVVLRVVGGGGYSEPVERDRDPARVAADVRSGLVTAEAARVSYGVVLDEAGRSDPSATSAEHGYAAVLRNTSFSCSNRRLRLRSTRSSADSPCHTRRLAAVDVAGQC
ncbi:hypothetical protein [Prauserella endophytica]|uniref:hypothetical protein n=1 Tax=Prauserella endophytica TaxID=1592324 RepID=UPI001981E845|nr:hypothetical protein [Prauserella endophytica]